MYGLIETFQDPWNAAVFANGDSNYESGHMYQGYGTRVTRELGPIISDLHYEGTDINRYNVGQYKIKVGPKKKSIKSYEGLQEFTKFVTESSTKTTPESEWEKVLDVDGFLRA